jgi:TorA maturation chaperone TorD
MVEPTDVSLARAVLAHHLKLALRAPDPSSHRELSSHGSGAVRRAAAVLGIAESAIPRTPALPELASVHTRLFGHSLRGRVCPYEIEYGKREPIAQAHELSDISGFYRAFGLEPCAKLNERWDHVGVELEFVELLSLKEAYALETGDEEMFELTRRALERFVREHLGYFGMALGARLEEEDPHGFYGRIGRLLARYLASVSAELGISAGPATLPLSAFEDDGVPMACGSGIESAEPAAFEV